MREKVASSSPNGSRKGATVKGDIFYPEKHKKSP
jgi:hypothetical protein